MLDKNKQIWFIGIKGTGMASLALLLHDLGYNVAGSDIEKYTFTHCETFFLFVFTSILTPQ